MGAAVVEMLAKQTVAQRLDVLLRHLVYLRMSLENRHTPLKIRIGREEGKKSDRNPEGSKG